MGHLVRDGRVQAVNILGIVGIGQHEGVDQRRAAATGIGIAARKEEEGRRSLVAEIVGEIGVGLFRPGKHAVGVEGRLAHPVGAELAFLTAAIAPDRAGHHIARDEHVDRADRIDRAFAVAGDADRVFGHAGQIPVELDREGLGGVGQDEKIVRRRADCPGIRTQVEGRAGTEARHDEFDRGAVFDRQIALDRTARLPAAPVEEAALVRLVDRLRQLKRALRVAGTDRGDIALPVRDTGHAGEDHGRAQQGLTGLWRIARHGHGHVDMIRRVARPRCQLDGQAGQLCRCVLGNGYAAIGARHQKEDERHEDGNSEGGQCHTETGLVHARLLFLTQSLARAIWQDLPKLRRSAA